jgi:Domain of Unknown Function (DUF928)
MLLLQLFSRLTSIALLTLLILANSKAVNATSKIDSTFTSWQTSSQESTSTSNGTPPPNSTASPRPGTTSCPQVDKPVVPLVYGRGADFTELEQPTLLFYIPYEAEEIGAIEIILRDPVSRVLAQYEVRGIARSGILKVTLPYSLDTHKNYEILFKLYCRDRDIDQSNPDVVLSTWVQRKPESAIDFSDLEPFERYQLYRENQIWYDAIATLADLHSSNPENPEISAAWSELLDSLIIAEELPEGLLNLEWLTEEPLVDSELHPL